MTSSEGGGVFSFLRRKGSESPKGDQPREHIFAEAREEDFVESSIEELRAAYAESGASPASTNMELFPVVKIEAQYGDDYGPNIRPDYMEMPPPGKPFTIVAPVSSIYMVTGSEEPDTPYSGPVGTEKVILHGGLGFGRGSFAWIPVSEIKSHPKNIIARLNSVYECTTISVNTFEMA